MASPNKRSAEELRRLEEKLAEYQGDDRIVSSFELAAKPDADTLETLGSGIPSLDRITGGFEAGEMVIVSGPTGEGKAEDVKEPVLTPAGWRKIGELEVGDLVYGSDGTPTKVLGVYDQGVRRAFRVRFNDGTSIVADGEHLWTVQSRKQRRTGGGWQTLTTAQLMEKGLLETGSDRLTAYQWFLPIVKPVAFRKKELPIPPYLMGVLLANGTLCSSSVTITTNEGPIMERAIRESGLEIRETTIPAHTARRWIVSDYKKATRAAGIDGLRSKHKFIPEDYLFSDIEDRRALLEGLMDCDGSVEKGKRAVYHTRSPQLSFGVAELARSLGGIARETSVTRKDGETDYNVRIWLPEAPFSLERKKADYYPRPWFKAVRSIEPEGECEMRCIRVDAADSLYVARSFTLTHNTTLLMSITRNMAWKDIPSVWFTLEVTPKSFIRKIKNACGEGRMPLFYLPNQNTENHLEWIEQRVIEAKVKYDAKVVFIDHIHQIFSLHKVRSSSVSLEIGDMVGKIKQMAIDHHLVIFLIAHTRDNSEAPTNEPRKEEIRDSGLISRLADSIVLVWRVRNEDPVDSKRRPASLGEEDIKAKIRVVKNRRDGRLGTFLADHQNGILVEASLDDYGG
jgi:replicative DNA helicase